MSNGHSPAAAWAPAYHLGQQIKGLLDRLAAGGLLVLLGPVLLVVALAIRLDSPGPVLYRSLRIGRNQAPFAMLKFRTMVDGADAQRAQLRQAAQLEGALFKLPDDPRVTRLGRWLRASSLDELPQLINVLRGEMSLVGPRPLPPDESNLFEAPYTLRYQVTPGITGLWQVSGRSALGFRDLCELELRYVTGWSLWQDLAILFRTVPVVLARRGAC